MATSLADKREAAPLSRGPVVLRVLHDVDLADGALQPTSYEERGMDACGEQLHAAPRLPREEGEHFRSTSKNAAKTWENGSLLLYEPGEFPLTEITAFLLQGKYTLTNATIDLDNFMLRTIIDGYVWRGVFTIFDQDDAMVICLQGAMQGVKIRSSA